MKDKPEISRKEPSPKKEVIKDASKLEDTNDVEKVGNDIEAGGEPAQTNLWPMDSPPDAGILRKRLPTP